MKAPRLIRLMAYYLFRGWYVRNMQIALNTSNAKRSASMDEWLNFQIWKQAKRNNLLNEEE